MSDFSLFGNRPFSDIGLDLSEFLALLLMIPKVSLTKSQSRCMLP